MVLCAVVVAVVFVAGDDGGWLWLWGGVFVHCLVGCGFWVWWWRVVLVGRWLVVGVDGWVFVACVGLLAERKRERERNE